VDDSGSMTCRNSQGLTRWEGQLEYLRQLIPFLVTLCGSVDVFFLNKPAVMKVTNISQLETAFSIPPEGGTPYFGAVRQIYTTYKKNLEEKGGLLFTTTDVAPSDYPHNNNEGQKKQDLIFLMKNERPKNIKSRKQGNVYISVVVFTDCEEDVEHLDDIRDLDPYHIAVTDDYVNERKEMLEIHGKSFKYSMVIILLLLLSVIIIIIVKY
jgi:hypothetical protein